MTSDIRNRCSRARAFAALRAATLAGSIHNLLTQAPAAGRAAADRTHFNANDGRVDLNEQSFDLCGGGRVPSER
jgi:hypothetical protein